MRASCGQYPALGRYFKTLDELASSACMSRRQCEYCLHGIKEFTRAQKTAIANAIIVKMVAKEIDSREMLIILKAREDFDEIFKKKAA